MAAQILDDDRAEKRRLFQLEEDHYARERARLFTEAEAARTLSQQQDVESKRRVVAELDNDYQRVLKQRHADLMKVDSRITADRSARGAFGHPIAATINRVTALVDRATDPHEHVLPLPSVPPSAILPLPSVPPSAYMPPPSVAPISPWLLPPPPPPPDELPPPAPYYSGIPGRRARETAAPVAPDSPEPKRARAVARGIARVMPTSCIAKNGEFTHWVVDLHVAESMMELLIERGATIHDFPPHMEIHPIYDGLCIFPGTMLFRPNRKEGHMLYKGLPAEATPNKNPVFPSFADPVCHSCLVR